MKNQFEKEFNYLDECLIEHKYLLDVHNKGISQVDGNFADYQTLGEGGIALNNLKATLSSNSDELCKMANDKSYITDGIHNPLAVATISMIKAGYTHEQIIQSLIDMGGNIQVRFTKLIQAFPAQYFNPKIIEVDESLFNKDSYFLASENMKREIKDHPELLYKLSNNTVLPPTT